MFGTSNSHFTGPTPLNNDNDMHVSNSHRMQRNRRIPRPSLFGNTLNAKRNPGVGVILLVQNPSSALDIFFKTAATSFGSLKKVK